MWDNLFVEAKTQKHNASDCRLYRWVNAVTFPNLGVKRFSSLPTYDFVVDFPGDGEYDVELECLARKNSAHLWGGFEKAAMAPAGEYGIVGRP